MKQQLALDMRSIKLVLFDLDGTLADTLPNLCAALNRALDEHSLAKVAAQDLRPVVSSGAKQMVRQALESANGDNLPLDQAVEEDIVDTFLTNYQQDNSSLTKMFDGMAETLATLEHNRIRWGIVTNKLEHFAVPIVEHLELTRRASCVISGDSAVHAKPHPAPLLLACRISAVAPHQSVYVGDAPGDVLAAHRAGMPALAALWGYLPRDNTPESWGAEALLRAPTDLPGFIGLQ